MRRKTHYRVFLRGWNERKSLCCGQTRRERSFLFSGKGLRRRHLKNRPETGPGRVLKKNRPGLNRKFEVIRSLSKQRTLPMTGFDHFLLLRISPTAASCCRSILVRLSSGRTLPALLTQHLTYFDVRRTIHWL